MSYNASVKFDSAAAEKRVNDLARNIGQLRNRFKEAATAAKTNSGSIREYTGTATRASSRTKVLVKDINDLSRAARKARTDVLGLARALNSGTFRSVSSRMREVSGSIDGVARSSRSATTSARSHATALAAATGAVGAYGRASQDAAKKVNEVGSASDKASRSFIGTASSVARLRNMIAFFGAGFGVSFLVDMADTAKLVAARLNIVATSQSNLISLEKRLYDVSIQTRSGYKENAALFTKLAMAGKAYGISQETSLVVTENVSKAMKISGASASEAAAATQQLSQAFSSGKIQGDELRSVLENSPRLAQALSTELADLGINLGNIRDKASEGKIGINELVRAFGSAKISDQLAKEFAKIPLTIGDSLTVAKTLLTKFIGELDKSTGASDKVARSIVFLAENAGTLASIIGVFLVGQVGKAIASFVAMRVASIGLAMTLGGVATASGAAAFGLATTGRAALALFGGLPGVILIAAGALGYFFSRSSEAASSQRNLANQVALASGQISAASLQSSNLSGATSVMANATVVAGNQFDVTRAKAFALGAQLGTVAAQALIAARALATTNLVKAQSNLVDIYQTDQRSPHAKFMGVKRGTTAADLAERERGLVAVRSAAYQKQLLENKIAKESAAGDQLLKKMGVNNPYSSPVSPKASTIGSGKSSDKKKGGGSDGGGADTTEQLKESLSQLKGQINETEAARSTFNAGMDTLNKSMKAGLITLEEYGKMSKELASSVFPGLKDAIKSVNEENEKLQMEADGLSDGSIKFNIDTKVIKEQVGQIDAIIAKQGDSNGILAAQKAELQGQVGQYAKILEQNDALKKSAEERRKQEEQINRLIDEASDRLYTMLTNRVSDALNFSKNSFKNFWKEVLSGAKDTIASILGAYVFEPMRQKFRTELEKAFKKGTAKTSKFDPTTITGSWSGVNNSQQDTTKDGEPSGTMDDPIIVDGSTGFWANFINGYKASFKDTIGALKSALKPLLKGLGDALGKLGINSGELGKTLGKAFGGAQIGSQIAGIGKMLGIKTSTTGGSIGGAIGSALPIPGGEIIGSVIGSIVGGMFKKAKFGNAVITGGTAADVTGSGNSASRQAASVGSAGTIQSSLNDIANRLGGTVGAFRISIGKVNDSFRVSTTGRTGKLKKGYKDVTDFKDDEAAAVAFAIKTAIEQGAISGLRASTNKLLKSGKDLEKAVQDALDFESVFTKFKQMTDPVGFAMENLGKEYTKLIDLFKEAGATSEEWSQLGAVFQQEISGIIKAEIDGLISFRDDLIGGDRSYKSQVDRLKIADSKFKTLEDRIASGGSVNQNEFTEAGQALQELARSVYGSTPEFQAYQQRLLDATNKLISNAQNENSTLQPVIEAINSNGRTAIAATNETNRLLGAIAGGAGASGTPVDYSGYMGGGDVMNTWRDASGF